MPIKGISILDPFLLVNYIYDYKYLYVVLLIVIYVVKYEKGYKYMV